MKTEQRTEKHAPYVIIPALIQVKHSNNVMIKKHGKTYDRINFLLEREQEKQKQK